MSDKEKDTIEVYELIDGKAVPVEQDEPIEDVDIVELERLDEIARNRELPFAERIENLKKRIPSKFHEILHAFSRRNSNEMSVKISVEFPLKQVSDFIVIKQIKISFKETTGKFNPYTLYIQYILRNGMQSELSTRNIWAKEGKFLTETDTNLSPEIRKIADNLAETFGFHSKRVTDIMFPF